MSGLIPPHGGKGLVCALLEGEELKAEIKKSGRSEKAFYYWKREW